MNDVYCTSFTFLYLMYGVERTLLYCMYLFGSLILFFCPGGEGRGVVGVCICVYWNLPEVEIVCM